MFSNKENKAKFGFCNESFACYKGNEGKAMTGLGQASVRLDPSSVPRIEALTSPKWAATHPRQSQPVRGDVKGP